MSLEADTGEGNDTLSPLAVPFILGRTPLSNSSPVTACPHNKYLNYQQITLSRRR